MLHYIACKVREMRRVDRDMQILSVHPWAEKIFGWDKPAIPIRLVICGWGTPLTPLAPSLQSQTGQPQTGDRPVRTGPKTMFGLASLVGLDMYESDRTRDIKMGRLESDWTRMKK